MIIAYGIAMMLFVTLGAPNLDKDWGNPSEHYTELKDGKIETMFLNDSQDTIRQRNFWKK